MLIRALVSGACDVAAILLAYAAFKCFSVDQWFWAAFLMVFSMDVVTLKVELKEALSLKARVQRVLNRTPSMSR
jgi:hypothetical protein